MSHPAHRIHTWPWLRQLGRLVLPNWLAITIGRHIFAWRTMTAEELEHELAHVRQWARHGWRFPLLYGLAALAARRTKQGWYHGNRFEADAREAVKRLRPR